MGKSRKPIKQARNVDAESGKDRVQMRGGQAPNTKKQRFQQEESDSDSVDSPSESETEKFTQASQKDDARSKKTKPKPKNKRDRNVRPTNVQDEADASDVEEVTKPKEATTGSHALMLLAMSYRMGFIKMDYPHVNQYYPDTRTMFNVLNEMSMIVSNNSLLHEVYPGYTSLGINCYYAHVVYYQILRVRKDNGQLGKVEKRCLFAYEKIGPPESWPVATPLIGYIQALGAITIEGGKYGKVLPALPDVSNLNSKKGLTKISDCRGIGRFPVVPALVQYLYNYAHKDTHFDDTDGFLYPKKSKKLEDSDEKKFVGLTSSKTDSKDFQTLVHSAGWNTPQESETDTFMMSTPQKQGIIKRWGIKSFSNTSELNLLDEYLGLTDAMEPSWIKKLLILSEEYNKFFPGSVNLSTVPLKTRMETVSKITVSKRGHAAATAVPEDNWYFTRKNWLIKLEGKIIRDDSQQAYQMASSLMIRTDYQASVIPAAIKAQFEDREFKVDEDDYFMSATEPRTEMYCDEMTDPFELVLQIIEGKMYDRFGGRPQ